MSTPLLYLIVGPNGAGKTTFYEEMLEPDVHVEFVNADQIASERWPGNEAENAYRAAEAAAGRREQLIGARESFIAETVFSHPSKLELLDEAKQAGYRILLQVILIPKALAIARVENRVENGGHSVPAEKIAARYDRLWEQVASGIATVDEARVFDNSRARSPFRLVAHYVSSTPLRAPTWPDWTPSELLGTRRR